MAEKHDELSFETVETQVQEEIDRLVENSERTEMKHQLTVVYKSGAILGPVPANWGTSYPLRQAFHNYINHGTIPNTVLYKLGNGSIISVDVTQVVSLYFLYVG